MHPQTKSSSPFVITKKRILYSFLFISFTLFIAITILLQSHARKITELRVSARRLYFQGKNSDFVRQISSPVIGINGGGKKKEEIYGYLKQRKRLREQHNIIDFNINNNINNDQDQQEQGKTKASFFFFLNRKIKNESLCFFFNIGEF